MIRRLNWYEVLVKRGFKSIKLKAKSVEHKAYCLTLKNDKGAKQIGAFVVFKRYVLDFFE
ncbi:hypothetical protein GCM10023231_04370 [Olivibacter ginsenosidimutans]|uniref:Uncharacterized protein n=1 Tax=Olivibacter ginsenosidimutans TaxID=1176537 RepID=A0ABP9AHT6_9SPHI